MNHTEEKAFRWIQSNFNLKEDDLVVVPETPSFLAKDGRRFAAKLAFGGKTVVFYGDEYEQIISDPDKNWLLLFNQNEEKPFKTIPGRVLAEMRNGMLPSVSFIHLKDRENENGQNSEIVLKLAKRNETSRYYRIGHLPMESLLSWKRGDYELKQSSGGGKGIEFFLVLRPMSFD